MAAENESKLTASQSTYLEYGSSEVRVSVVLMQCELLFSLSLKRVFRIGPTDINTADEKARAFVSLYFFDNFVASKREPWLRFLCHISHI